jgi:NAD(P)-dependent dehydrogenase (short-subunit alcohol dehydrogenase family)
MAAVPRNHPLAGYLPNIKPTPQYYAFCAAFIAGVFGFIGLRFPEIASLAATNPIFAILILAVNVGMATMVTNPPAITSAVIRRVGMILMVLASLKNELDSTMKKLAGQYDLTGVITVVTGANSGTGLGIAQVLAGRGADVVMACRSIQKCRAAQLEIEKILETDIATARGKNATVPLIPPGKLHVMQLDLGDLASVRSFADDLSAQFPRVDVLVNNAGLVTVPGARTKQGFEEMLGVMHVGHFALTEWLMPMLLKADSEDQPAQSNSLLPQHSRSTARVINIASQVYSFGSFDGSLMRTEGEGDWRGELTDNCAHIAHLVPCCPFINCPVSNGYARAKLANVLHIHELQRRTDLAALEAVRQGLPAPRRLVAASLHPGTVQTHLVSFFSSKWMDYLLRKREDAAMLTLKAVESDKYVPSSYLDGMGNPHDLANYRSKHLAVHLEAHAQVVASNLPFQLPPNPKLTKFSLDKFTFDARHFVTADGTHYAADEVAARLWDVTHSLVSKWEADSNVADAASP